MFENLVESILLKRRDIFVHKKKKIIYCTDIDLLIEIGYHIHSKEKL